MANRPQYLNKVKFIKLKNLRNVEINFGKGLTGIFGANGSGKSTVLHALACIYKPISGSGRKNFRFSDFFLPSSLSLWQDSEFEVTYEHKDETSFVIVPPRKFRKCGRWTPRYEDRPTREVFFIGIESCLPAIEEINRQSKLQLLPCEICAPDIADKIRRHSSYILHRYYTAYLGYEAGNKKYEAATVDAVTYPSLYMGAGEQRVIRILTKVLSVPEYSLILIDEIDLTFHTRALLRLIEILKQIAEDRKLQIVFTSHREELLDCQGVEYRHLWNRDHSSDTLCFENTTPECIERMTGQCPKPIEVFVEDDFAEAMVRQILIESGIQRFCKITRYGSYHNAFLMGAGLLLKGETMDNAIIVLDGDVVETIAKKQEEVNKVITGSDAESANKRKHLLNKIIEFSLPLGQGPEQYVNSLLKNLDDCVHLLVPLIKATTVVADKHKWINDPIDQSGLSREVALADIARIFSTLPEWANYKASVEHWLLDKKAEHHL